MAEALRQTQERDSIAAKKMEADRELARKKERDAIESYSQLLEQVRRVCHLPNMAAGCLSR